MADVGSKASADNTVVDTPAAPAPEPNKITTNPVTTTTTSADKPETTTSTTSTSTSASATAPANKDSLSAAPAATKPAPAVEPSKKADDNDPTTHIKQCVTSLVYWEKPVHSGVVLAGLLGTLVLTQYYSVLQLAAAFFTLVTGINLVYVNAHKQGQRFFSGKSVDQLSHPHSQRFKNTYIPRDRVVKSAQLAVDVIEAVVQQVTKLVLIEDTWRSAWAVGIAYFVWTLATYVATKYLVGVFIVGVFSMPRVYSQHKQLIDSQVAQHSQRAKDLAEQYGSVASTKAKELYNQAMASVSKKKSE
ncbi:hypothetical protein LRAMOSA02025 [Lichtheimia ramosa]|uniref:Reticulon-like protein n=1 Tax=Lichtheimia ramosa TaxID=688394 RepID=A0A077WK06_9FUNG|nr:hypothetical protein LRAMOSA02025 [Lichtheimia ramosa]